MITSNHKSIATFIHLGVFSKYFIPFGNYIIPIILWATNKDKSDFIDANGKEAINFQLSILLYTIILGALSVSFFLFNLFDGISFLDFNTWERIDINFLDSGGFRIL